MENVWFCFSSIVWFNFGHKTERFQFWKSLKYFNVFWQKNITSDLNLSQGKMSDFLKNFIVRVHFNYKTNKFWFLKSLKYFNSFLPKRWGQIGICSTKQCLMWFNFRCLSIIFAISWEILLLNFIAIVQLRNMMLDQNLLRTWLSNLYFFGIIIEIVTN